MRIAMLVSLTRQLLALESRGGGGRAAVADGEARTDGRKERCVIVGAGVVGLTTAYVLSRASDKYEIHIVDQHDACAMGASFQNGGVINVESLSPIQSYMDLGATLARSARSALTGEPANSLVSWRALAEPGLLSWLWHFYQNKPAECVERNACSMLRLGTASGSLSREAFSHLRLDRAAHNFAERPGLLLKKVAAPREHAAERRAATDHIHQKTYVGDEAEVAEIRRDSGLAGLDEEGGYVGEVDSQWLGEDLLARQVDSELCDVPGITSRWWSRTI
jgi:glycine/D-amino acid oxidase-like deaminating enzyme